jgi:hypothetical protein
MRDALNFRVHDFAPAAAARLLLVTTRSSDAVDNSSGGGIPMRQGYRRGWVVSGGLHQQQPSNT